jgi:hypothetical protein
MRLVGEGGRFVVKSCSFRTCFAAGFGGLVLLAIPHPAAAKTCQFSWAIPGVYELSGNFRGRVESTSARLTNDCKIVLRIPGVFTGGDLVRAGQCLKFSFKVQGERRVFTARWCNTYGIVPWRGRNIRATVKRKQIAREETPTKFNFTGSPEPGG